MDLVWRGRVDLRCISLWTPSTIATINTSIGRTPIAMMTWARMPTSEPEVVELETPASACDDAAAAACDNAAADSPMDVDAAADDAAAFCPTASYDNVVCDAGSTVEVPPSNFAEGTLVNKVDFGFTVIEKLDCARDEDPRRIVVKTYPPSKLILIAQDTSSEGRRQSVGSFSNSSSRSNSLKTAISNSLRLQSTKPCGHAGRYMWKADC